MVNFSVRLDQRPAILLHKEGAKYLACSPHFARSPQPVAHNPHTLSPQSVAHSLHTSGPQSVARSPQPAL